MAEHLRVVRRRPPDPPPPDPPPVNDEFTPPSNLNILASDRGKSDLLYIVNGPVVEGIRRMVLLARSRRNGGTRRILAVEVSVFTPRDIASGIVTLMEPPISGRKRMRSCSMRIALPTFAVKHNCAYCIPPTLLSAFRVPPSIHSYAQPQPSSC